MPRVREPFPAYIKFAQILTGIAALIGLLYIAQGIFLPLIFAVLLALLLNPVVNFLVRKRFNRVLAITIALLGFMTALGLLAWFISSQIAAFTEDLPTLRKNFELMYDQFTTWLQKTFHISRRKVVVYLNQLRSQSLSSGGALIGQTLVTITGAVGMLILIPVYIFLILLYKPLMLGFMAMLFRNADEKIVTDVIAESKSLIQSYLYGLLIEMVLVAVLNSVGLLIIGMESAILLGVIAALLNIIPYLGGIVATGVAMLVAMATKGASLAGLVLLVFLVVQLIDNNFLVPKIVASKVRINALASIVAVLAGGLIWGIPGMFISIPLTALCKVVFDHVEGLKPFGLLLGDTMPRFGTASVLFRPKPKLKIIPDNRD
jgi:predicted PurR-regulated permease PerM